MMTYSRTCTVAGCGRKHEGRGYCSMHGQRVRRTGSIDLLPGRRGKNLPKKLPGDVRERFWKNVDKSGDCWVWTGLVGPKGYGQLNVLVADVGWRTTRAHRLSYELAYGPIPPGLMIRHKCDNPPCVNPAHLETGTHEDNTRDMVERGRAASGENHPHARFTEKDVAAIRVRLKDGESCISIARSLGVVEGTIYAIDREITWRRKSA